VLLLFFSCVSVYAGQLKFDGVPVDITTADNEDLVLAPGSGGNTQIGVGTGTNSYAVGQNDLFVTGIIETAGAGYFDSSLTAAGAFTANGNVTLGDATSDTITTTGRFSSSLLPSAASTYDLGSASYSWANIYVDSIKAKTSFNLSIVPSSGNVGIGTSSPVRKLDVLGSTGIGIGTTTAGDAMIVSSKGNVGIGSSVPISLLDVNSKLNVLSGGNVGIGIVVPAYKLDVAGDINSTGTIYGNISASSGSSSLASLTVTGNTALATTSGNVGIGTSVVTGGRAVIKGAGTSTGVGLQTQDSSGNAKVTILDNGNIGVGSTIPVYNVDVNGSLRATSLIGPVTGSVAFNNLTTGTNSQAAMTLDTGSSLNYTNSGTINASSLQSSTWAVPAGIGSTTPNTAAFTTFSSAPSHLLKSAGTSPIFRSFTETFLLKYLLSTALA